MGSVGCEGVGGVGSVGCEGVGGGGTLRRFPDSDGPFLRTAIGDGT